MWFVKLQIVAYDEAYQIIELIFFKLRIDQTCSNPLAVIHYSGVCVFINTLPHRAEESNAKKKFFF